MRLSASLVAALLTLVVTVTGCSSLEGTGDKGYISGDGRIVQIPVGERGEPVELTGESLEGDAVDLQDYRGDVVVVNMWWSGCGPCRTEMPMLAKVGKEHAETARLVGINIRDSSQAQGLAFQRKVGVEFPSIWAPDGRALLAFAGRVSLSSVPSTAILDREGRVAAVISGDIPGEVSLVDLIEEVAAENG